MYFIATSVNIGKKTGAASEKQPPRRQGNVSSGKSVVTGVNDGEYRDVISNLMEPHHPYLLPRTVPTSAGVIFQKPQLAITQDLSVAPFGGLIIRPEVERTVTHIHYSPPTEVLGATDFYGGKGYIPNGNLSDIGVSVPLTLVNDTVLNPSYEPFSGIMYIDLNGDLVYDSKPYWPNLTVSATGVITVTCITFRTLTWPVMLQHRTSSAVPWTTIDTENMVAIDGGWSATLNIGAALLSGDFAIQMGGFVAHDVRFSVRVDPTQWDTQGQYVSTDYSLWELLGDNPGSEIVKTQFENAERYSITGFSALLQNATAQFYKSGSVVGAQFPGGSEPRIPQNGDAMYKFISSFNDPKTYSGQLNKGLHWFFAPEKIQDWFFQPTSVERRGEKPFFACAWSGVAVNDLANMLGLVLDIRANIELLSTDISLMKFSPSSDLLRLMDLYVTLVSAHNPVGENPSHMSKIKKIVGSILSNPVLRSTLKQAALAGLKLVPLAIGAV